VEKGVVAGNVCVIMNLYHFTKADTAQKHILPKMNLKFNKVSKMNDPVENLLHLTNSQDLIYNHYGNGFVEAIQMQENWQIISFSSNENENCYENQSMWTHYGQNNTGVCFEIDYDEFISENNIKASNLIKDRKVDYINTIPKYTPSKLHGVVVSENNDWVKLNKERNEKFTNDIFNYYLTKNTYWEIENEYRFIMNSHEETFLNISKSLKSVYLGVGFLNRNLHEILKYVPKAKVYIMRVNSFGVLEKYKL
jgi:hypothetical protein